MRMTITIHNILESLGMTSGLRSHERHRIGKMVQSWRAMSSLGNLVTDSKKEVMYAVYTTLK